MPFLLLFFDHVFNSCFTQIFQAGQSKTYLAFFIHRKNLKDSFTSGGNTSRPMRLYSFHERQVIFSRLLDMDENCSHVFGRVGAFR